MFDLLDHEDYKDIIGGDIHTEVSDIEDDISLDIDNLLKNRFDKMYHVDKFKHKTHNIDIIYPKMPYTGKKSLLKGPDYIRFLLSLYPNVKDFENIEKIVLRPRYFEINNIELMAIYIRNKKLMVMYLHHPYYYPIDDKFIEYTEFFPPELSRITNKHPQMNQNKNESNIIIPPLWYLLSMISYSGDNKIDKFFLKCEKEMKDNAEVQSLCEISFYYSRFGY